MQETPLEASRKYVVGIGWPASKEEVLTAVERNGAPEDVMQVLRAVDKPRFVSATDVHQALWAAA